MSSHFMQIYENDAFLIGQVSDFICAGLRDGDAAVVISTPAHREAIEDQLRADARVASIIDADSSACTWLDATEVQMQFMDRGWPGAQRFLSYFTEIVQTASKGHQRPVRAFGEIVAELVEADNVDAAVRVEELWNELAATQPLTLFCAYPMRCTPKMLGRLATICSTHSRVTVPAHLCAQPRLAPAA